MKNFMNQLKSNLRVLFMLALTFIFTLSCDIIDPEPPIPACESGNYGTVKVINNTGFKIMTDVTWGSMVENSERTVSYGGSTTYSEVQAGRIEIWITLKIADSWTDWDYEVESLSACEDMDFTWTLSGKKSAGQPELVIEIDRKNGVKENPYVFEEDINDPSYWKKVEKDALEN